jgi:carboxypeptidase Q
MSRVLRFRFRTGLLAAAAGAGVMWLISMAHPAHGQFLNASQVLSEGQTAAATALRDAALKNSGAINLVRSLATEVGPRLAGSPGDPLAVAWAVRTLKALGFSNVHTEKVMVPHWERGAESAEIVAPYPQRLSVCALGGSAGTPEGGIEAPVVAVDGLAGLDHLDPAKAKGKIVFVDVLTKRTRNIEGYATAVPVRGDAASHAARLGALAVVIRSIGTDENRLPHTGALRYDEGQPHIPAAALSSPDADLLRSEIASGKPVTLRLRLGARTLPESESANVIGEITGSAKPNEIVLLGCHLDSWDLGEGAIDDGAGCAIVIEAARRLGELKPHPRRTVRVVLFANEEFGLSGARAYAEAHQQELANHVMAAESDLGSGRPWRLSTRIAPESFGWLREISRLVFPLGVAAGDNQADGGADLSPLLPARVPMLQLDQDATNYFDFHHSANDTVDKIVPRDLDYNVADWVVMAYVAADIPGNFGRAPLVEDQPPPKKGP